MAAGTVPSSPMGRLGARISKSSRQQQNYALGMKGSNSVASVASGRGSGGGIIRYLPSPRVQCCIYVSFILTFVVYVQHFFSSTMMGNGDIYYTNNNNNNSPAFGSQRIEERNRDRLREEKRQRYRFGGASILSSDRKATDAGASDVDESLAAQSQALRPPPQVVEKEYPKFNYSLPAQPNVYTLKDPQLYGNNKMNDEPKGSNMTASSTDASMIILILSGRENIRRRKAIRETWGKDHAIYFVIGGPTMPELDEIQQYNEKHKNVTISDHQVDGETTKSLNVVENNDNKNNNPRQHERKNTSVEKTIEAVPFMERRRRRLQEYRNQESRIIYLPLPPLPPPASSASASKLLYKTSIQIELEQEQETYKDIIDTWHPDSYSSLPFKVRFAYRWIVEHYPNVQWIVKVDDDTVVRVDTLSKAFLRNFNPNIPMVIGKIVERSAVARGGKWAETLYEPDFYPYWPQGSCGHIVSRVVAHYIGVTLQNPVYYQGEDVSIGIWLDEAPDKPGNELAEHVTWIHSDYFRNDRKCMDHAWLIMGHEVTAEEMRMCYHNADEWPIDDIQHKHRRYWKIETLQQRKSKYEW